MTTIHQVIGKINPSLYALNEKELLKEYGSWEEVPTEKIKSNALFLTSTAK